MSKAFRLLLVTATVALATGRANAAAVDVELNRLDPREGGCRVQMVVKNGSKTTYSGFALDLVIFDTEGQISRRTALDVAPVRGSKTTVYAFDVKGVRCESVGSILLNDVVDCAQASGPIADCVDQVGTRSRAKVPFNK